MMFGGWEFLPRGAGFRTALYSFTDIISLISCYPKIVKKQIVNFYIYIHGGGGKNKTTVKL